MYETFYGCLNCNWDILVDLQAMRPNKKQMLFYMLQESMNAWD